MLIPVAEELLHEGAAAVGVSVAPVGVVDLEPGDQIAGLRAERQDRFVEVVEVLVEGGGLEADLVRYVGEPDAAQAVLLDGRADDLQYPLASAQSSLTEWLSIDRTSTRLNSRH